MKDLSNIKISIVMPVYNASSFLHDSIGDVLSQSFTDFELICVDDGSTDGSSALLDEFAVKDSRIKVVHQENRGGGAARNTGIQYATGKYLLFLDADDRFEQNLLELSVKKAEEERADVVVYDADAFDYATGAKRKAQWLIYDDDLDPDNPFASVNNSVWNKLFLRENIEKYGIRFTERRAAYSTSFVVCAMMVADRIRMIKDVLLHYRMNNPSSNVTNEDKDSTAIVDALLEVKLFLENNGLYEKKEEQYLYLFEKEIMTRLSFMKTIEGYRKLYNYAHEKCAEIPLKDDTEYTAKDERYNRLRNLRDYDEDEYLYNQLEETRRRGVLEKQVFFLPELEKDGRVKLAIYGAGNVGKDFFIQALRREDIDLVCWVDKNFEKIGFPVQSPDVLSTADYDIVLIAVSDNRTANGIKQSLTGQGIPADKIYYRIPEVL